MADQKESDRWRHGTRRQRGDAEQDIVKGMYRGCEGEGKGEDAHMQCDGPCNS
jgi:hypothetical protein